jgi:hypothetical protein
MMLGPIPSSFVLQKAERSLPELRWALENGLIGVQNVVDAAGAMLACGQDSDLLVRLAGVTHAEFADVTGMLAEVRVPEPTRDVRRKWATRQSERVAGVKERASSPNASYMIACVRSQRKRGPIWFGRPLRCRTGRRIIPPSGESARR